MKREVTPALVDAVWSRLRAEGYSHHQSLVERVLHAESVELGDGQALARLRALGDGDAAGVEEEYERPVKWSSESGVEKVPWLK